MSSTHLARTRARRGLRGLVATSGLALVASSAALVASPAHAADPVDINLLATNDFHGRILANGIEAGAPTLAGAVEQIRGQHPNTVFAAAGDLIGASTFESFIAHDKPTIDALNAAGLEVSAVGNHELDQGYNDLVNRVMKPYDPNTNPYGGASWHYLAANLKMKATGDPAVPATWMKSMGGVQVGFVGAVTEHLPELVSPAGIADIQVTDIVDAVNTQAAALKADGADIVVMLVHEGASSTNCATMDDDPTSDFGSIINGVDGDVDAIVSGHTHLAYDCKFPVAAWAGRPVTERPVVSAGQYGYNLNQLDYSVDPTTGQVLGVTTGLLSLTAKNPDGTPKYPADPTVQQIVDQAKANADVLGAAPLGQIAGPFNRAFRPKVPPATGVEENRGGESTLGNLVAEAQRWATQTPTSGGAQIAFMNPGGLRADMVGSNASGYPATLTYKQAANVQPFANTLVNMKMTGAQIAQALGQQWQPAGSSRPFLRLGASQGFTYTYDPVAKKVDHMWLNGQPMSSDQTYSVTVNSFLASGGDNFGAFALGTDRRDTGKIDLSAMVDYMAAVAKDKPLPVDSSQRAVGVQFPTGAPAGYLPATTVSFQLSSLAMTAPGDTQDSAVTVALGDQQLGSFPVDNTVAAGNTSDEPGTASVSVRLPADTAPGTQVLTATGNRTGTVVRVPVTVLEPAPVAMHVKVTPQKVWAGQTRPMVHVDVAAADGSVEVTAGGASYTAAVSDGEAIVRLAPFGSPGRQAVVVRYRDTDGVQHALQTVMVTVDKK